MPVLPTTLTRAELHRMVWTEPGTHLAARFGLSDSGLAKICRKLDVPRPPPGWWAKSAAGRKVRITPLPDARPGVADRVTIRATPDSGSAVRDAVSSEAARIGAITIPERLTRPHPLISGWRARRREQQALARRERDPWRRTPYAVADFTSAERRRHRVLHALFRALERRNAVICEDDRGRLSATLGGETIPFDLREKQRQVTRPLTADEKRWETWNRSGVRRELEPTGRLGLTVSARTEQPVRRTWLETDRRAIDAMLPEIVATFLVLAPILAEQSRRREEAARRWAEEQRRREEERERQREDDNRWRRFMELAGAWRQAALARDFIAALRAGECDPDQVVGDRSVGEWLMWAEQHAEGADPSRGGLQRVFSELLPVHSWTYRD